MKRTILAWLLWGRSPIASWHPSVQFERAKQLQRVKLKRLKIWLYFWGKWMKITHGERYHT